MSFLLLVFLIRHFFVTDITLCIFTALKKFQPTQLRIFIAFENVGKLNLSCQSLRHLDDVDRKYLPDLKKRNQKDLVRLGPLLWRSWQSGRFRHQRSVVRISTSAKFFNCIYLSTHVNCKFRKDQKKEKRPGLARLKKIVRLLTF